MRRSEGLLLGKALTTFLRFRSLLRALSAINRDALPVGEEHWAKSAISQFYDDLADAAKSHLYWNWGYFDERTAAIAAPFCPASSDGLSEQLYLMAAELTIPAHRREFDLVEVGCGLGEGLRFLSQCYPAGSFIGIDLSDHAIRQAQDKSAQGRLRFALGDAARLPIEDHSADCVMSVESMHNYPSAASFLDEAARVLRPGGVLGIVDLFTATRAARFRALVKDHPRFEFLVDEDISNGVRRAIAKRIGTNGSAASRQQDGASGNLLRNLIRDYGRRTMLGADFLRTQRGRFGQPFTKLLLGSEMVVESYRRIALKRT